MSPSLLALSFCCLGLKYEVMERAERVREYGTNYYAHNFLPAAYEAKIKKEGTATK